MYNEYNKLSNIVKTPSHYEKYNKEYKQNNINRLALQNTLTTKNFNQDTTKIKQNQYYSNQTVCPSSAKSNIHNKQFQQFQQQYKQQFDQDQINHHVRCRTDSQKIPSDFNYFDQLSPIRQQNISREYATNQKLLEKNRDDSKVYIQAMVDIQEKIKSLENQVVRMNEDKQQILSQKSQVYLPAQYYSNQDNQQQDFDNLKRLKQELERIKQDKTQQYENQFVSLHQNLENEQKEKLELQQKFIQLQKQLELQQKQNADELQILKQKQNNSEELLKTNFFMQQKNDELTLQIENQNKQISTQSEMQQEYYQKINQLEHIYSEKMNEIKEQIENDLSSKYENALQQISDLKKQLQKKNKETNKIENQFMAFQNEYQKLLFSIKDIVKINHVQYNDQFQQGYLQEDYSTLNSRNQFEKNQSPRAQAKQQINFQQQNFKTYQPQSGNDMINKQIQETNNELIKLNYEYENLIEQTQKETDRQHKAEQRKKIIILTEKIRKTVEQMNSLKIQQLQHQ